MTVNLNDISSYSNAFNSRSLLLLANRPNTEFWIKTVNIPAINMEGVQDVPRQPYTIKVEGNTLSFEDLSLSVFLDEDFQVYKEIYTWFKDSIPDSEGSTRPQTSGSIVIFNNTFTKVVAQFDFEGLFITGLPSIPYDNYSAEPIALDLTMTYNKFTPAFLK